MIGGVSQPDRSVEKAPHVHPDPDPDPDPDSDSDSDPPSRAVPRERPGGPQKNGDASSATAGSVLPDLVHQLAQRLQRVVLGLFLLEPAQPGLVLPMRPDAQLAGVDRRLRLVLA